MKIKIIIFQFIFVFSVSAIAELVHEPARDREILDIASQLRCAVCQSQSVAESNSDLANDMKAIIGEQLDEGASSAAILDYFVQRYGDYILMKPRTDGVGWLLWWFPVAIIGLVLLLVFWQIRARAAASGVPSAVDSDAHTLDGDQRQRLQQLRDRQP
ncbi:MAG: cytochrome c-type biogenesis protein CcmH [Gammaproteobacteria bacterium]|nr:MAG: cytochrome c-type biogenesis protein CcmH [Gammaproteobacteria bacterium]RLA18194.1 MAG: cytochrome c-type biogenesis protein CcmH [Gammaproteobacteria bacterium]